MTIDPKKFATRTPIAAVQVADFGPVPTDAEIDAARARHAAERANAKPYAPEDLDGVDYPDEINWLRFVKTVEDNARLRALIKAQEWGSESHGDPACPWCPALRIDHTHLPTCPAFSPEGQVR